MAAVCKGDTLVVPKLDRLVSSVPDARHIADQLRGKEVKLAIGRMIHDPDGKMFFNIPATFAEFETDLIRMRTREGMAVKDPEDRHDFLRMLVHMALLPFQMLILFGAKFIPIGLFIALIFWLAKFFVTG